MTTEPTEPSEEPTPPWTRIPSLNQYAAAQWQRMREDYGTTITEDRELYPVSSWESTWYADVVKAVDAGVLPSGKLWRSLTDHQQHGLLRTHRALSDDEFARELVELRWPDRRRKPREGAAPAVVTEGQ